MRQPLSLLLLPTFGLLACAGSTVPFEILEHDGIDREYYLYAPENLDSAQAAPLLFNFHGNGQTAGSHVDWSDFRPLADEHGFLVVYPQGVELEGDTHWNSALPGNGNKSSTDDFGFVLSLIDALSETYNVDSDRIYATGYSNGGFMSYSLACYHSDRFAAISAVSSTMLNQFDGDCAPTRPISVLSANGTADFAVPYDGGMLGYQSIPDVLNYWVTQNNIVDEPEVTDVTGSIQRTLYSNGDQGVSVDHYRVEGGSHVWFEQDFGGNMLTELVWEFFASYGLNGAMDSMNEQ